MYTVDVNEIARMLNEDALKRGNKVLPWESCGPTAEEFWREKAKEFIAVCLKEKR